MKKKSLVMLVSAAVLLVSAAIGTVAYFTDSATLTNNFTVGNVSIRLEETQVNASGKPVDDQGVETQTPVLKPQGNTFHLMPGQTYVKDPTLTVEQGSEEAYLRLIVTITHLDKVKAVLGADFLPQNYVTGWDAAIWPCVSVTETTEKVNAGTPDETDVPIAQYEFRYHKTVAADTAPVKLEPLMNSFTVPAELTGLQLNQLSQMEVRVNGHAIQATGFTTADEAWAAFAGQTTPPANP